MSMRKAINDHCKSCIYDPLAGGTWRAQVQNCTISRCSLWEYRPLVLRARAKDRVADTRESAVSGVVSGSMEATA